MPYGPSVYFGYTREFWRTFNIFRQADTRQSRILRLRRSERYSAGSSRLFSCFAGGKAHIRASSDLIAAMVVSMKADKARLTVGSERSDRHNILIQGLSRSLGAFCSLMVSLVPLDAVAQITESLLPYPVAPRAPQEQPSAFAPLGVRLGSFFWFPRAELDGAYNSNIFATTTSPTYDLITALTPSFDLQSNFPRNALSLHAGSLLQVYADHPAQNTQDGIITMDGRLDVTAGSSLYGSAQVGHQHISYGSPNLVGNVAQPVTYWDYTATAGYAQGLRRFSYQVDLGVTAVQYNAALLVGGDVLPQSSQDVTISSAAVRGSYEIIPDYLGYE